MTVYDVHGVGVEVRADDPLVAAAVEERLRHFGRRDSAAAVSYAYAREDRNSRRPEGEGRPVYDPPRGEVLHFSDSDTLTIDYEGRVSVFCDAARGRARVSVGDEEADNLWLLSRPLFTLGFLELAKRCGLYGIHAAGVADGDQGVVLAGGSGAGKSTLTVALLRAGFGFLSDDLVFLRKVGGGVDLLAFPDDIDLTPTSVALCPGVEERLPGEIPAGWPKHRVAADTALGAPVVESSHPRALILPRVSGAARSVARPVSPAEALVALAPNIMLTEPSTSQAHLDALAGLVASCPAYRLETGRDLEAVPDLIRGLLQ